jgi:hypothetical protein
VCHNTTDEIWKNEAIVADMQNFKFISKKSKAKMIDHMAHPSFKRFYEKILQ